MKIVVSAVLVLSAASANAQTPAQRFPSCDLKAQHALRGETGGSVEDPRQAHVLMRSEILQADLGSARKARRLTQASADRLYRRVETVKADADRSVRRQGFLSAAEVATYDRGLDAVAREVCRR